MTRIFRPNPHSLVQKAIADAGGHKVLAEKLHLSPQTVQTWAKNDRITLKHILKVCVIADIPPMDLIQYIERKKKPWFFKTPEAKPNALETLQAVQDGDLTLFQAFEATRIPVKVIKQTLTLWGDRLALLRTTLQSDAPKETKAHTLGVTVRQLNRLIKTYLPEEPKQDKPYVLARESSQRKWKQRKAQAVRVIRGDTTVVAAAKAIDISDRQMHRWMDKTLGDRFNLGLNQIRPLPRPFRFALAEEVTNEDHPEVIVHLINYWKQHNLVRRPMPRAPESWKREPVRRCLIGLFTGEISLDALCEAKETHKRMLIPLLTGNLIQLGMSFEQAATYSVQHQESLAEILNSLTETAKKTHIVDDSPPNDPENHGNVVELRRK